VTQEKQTALLMRYVAIRQSHPEKLGPIWAGDGLPKIAPPNGNFDGARLITWDALRNKLNAIKREPAPDPKRCPTCGSFRRGGKEAAEIARER